MNILDIRCLDKQAEWKLAFSLSSGKPWFLTWNCLVFYQLFSMFCRKRENYNLAPGKNIINNEQLSNPKKEADCV